MLPALIIATHNSGKIREMRDALRSVVGSVLSLDDVSGVPDDLPETGDTFAANAEQKASAVLNITQTACLADDSGLSVNALAGFPGVNSARWLLGTDQDRITALLEKMRGHTDRRAQFNCVLCLCEPDQPSRYFEGVITGRLARTPVGNEGFGYDPIFIPDGETRTLAELGVGYKTLHSHRAQALQKAQAYLSQL